MNGETLPRGRRYFDLDEDGCGIPWEDFIKTLSVWAWMRKGDERSTVAEAAGVFQVTEDVVREAVEDHPWLFLSGDTIEHDGA